MFRFTETPGSFTTTSPCVGKARAHNQMPFIPALVVHVDEGGNGSIGAMPAAIQSSNSEISSSRVTYARMPG